MDSLVFPLHRPHEIAGPVAVAKKEGERASTPCMYPERDRVAGARPCRRLARAMGGWKVEAFASARSLSTSQ